MFSSVVQPPLVSLFSSTGSEPLALFSSRTDANLPADSFVHLLRDSTSTPAPSAPRTLITLATSRGDAGGVDYYLNQTVLHIQSPTLVSTYIQSKDLGLKHPWIHLQVRNLGREWSFEVGVVDSVGREGIIRCSTFQEEPHLRTTSPPLLHLPLSFPAPASRPLTSWSTISLNLAQLLPHFLSPALWRGSRDDDDDDDYAALSTTSTPLPGGTFSRVSYVRVYATCRLRRIWFTESRLRTGQQPWEFELYGAQ